jgi:hypothetical protein
MKYEKEIGIITIFNNISRCVLLLLARPPKFALNLFVAMHKNLLIYVK